MKRLLSVLAGLAVSWPFAANASNHWHYPFDGHADDVGGNAQNGWASPGVSFPGGIVGTCARFSGEEFVSLPLDFNDTPNLSFAFWLKVEGPHPGPYYAMLLSSDADSFGRGIAIDLENGEYQLWTGDGTANAAALAPPAGQWQHIGLTYGENGATLYLDGTEALFIPSPSQSPPFNDATNVLVGLRNLFFDRGANASIDELHVFDRTLPPEEILALARDNQSPLAHYAFDDNLDDSTPNAFHGIPSSALAFEDGIRGRALAIPADQFVSLPIDLNSCEDLSFAFWLKINAPPPGPYYGMFLSTDNNTYGRGLGVDLENNRFQLWFDDGVETARVQAPPVGLWQRVGMSYSPGFASFYVNGRCVHSTTQHLDAAPYNDATNVLLGLRNLFFDRGTDFSIDELRINNRALSSSEMQSFFGLDLSVVDVEIDGPAILPPRGKAPFSCIARCANGQLVDVASISTFHVAPGVDTNVVWFEDNVLRSAPQDVDQFCHVYATFEHASGRATSRWHDVVVKAPDNGSCLLAYYPLDGTALDASGNGFDGVVNDASPSDDAIAGTSFSFNGQNSVSLPVDLNDSAEISFAFWFKILGPHPGPYYAMLLSSDNNQFGRGIAIDLASANLMFWFDDGFEYTLLPAPSAGEWHHLAATYSPGNNALYFNGVEVYRNNLRDALPPFNDSTNLLLGLRNTFFDRGFNGLIDEVAIFGCALSSNDVWNLYSSFNGETARQPSPVDPQAASNAARAPLLLSFRASPGSSSTDIVEMSLNWEAAANQACAVLFSTNLLNPVWIPLPGILSTNPGSARLAVPPGLSKAFFKIVASPASIP